MPWTAFPKKNRKTGVEFEKADKSRKQKVGTNGPGSIPGCVFRFVSCNPFPR